MIRTEKIIIDGKDFIRTYSDNNFMIERDGVQYDEAIDPINTGRTYVETSVKREISDYEYIEAGKILLGVSE